MDTDKHRSAESQPDSLSSIRWRRGLGRGGSSLFKAAPLLNPLPTRASLGEEESLSDPCPSVSIRGFNFS